MGDDVQDRLAALEARVRELEDQAAILRLMNSWGPAVDTGLPEEAAALWTDDCVLDSDYASLEGPAAIHEMTLSDGQQSLITQGCAHVQGYPVIAVDGDRATATGYSRVDLHTADGYEAWRVSANHWEFRRTPDGWRVARRTVRTIDGEEEPKRLLQRAFRSSA